MVKNSGIKTDSRLDWYLKAKFGLFLHWGAYSAAGVEASWPVMAPAMSEAMFRVPSTISYRDYESLPRKFNPHDFNAGEWVRLAAQSGMRYIVITSKHHDGFCMFDAPGTDYKITNTPFGRDVCAELAEACAAAEMPLGFYYSPPDMHHPGYRDTSKPVESNWTGEPGRPEWNEYLDYMESHIIKLLTDYGKVSILWFDGLANHGKYDPERFHALIRRLSPETLVNDRLGEGFDFVTPEQFIPKSGIPAKSGKMPSGMDPGGDAFFRAVNTLFKIPGLRQIIKSKMNKYNDGELELSPVYQENYPLPERFQPWETCMTVGSTWAFNPDEKGWKNSSELIRSLALTVSKGGNFLLNAGPTDRGWFQPAVIDRMSDIGRWLDKYGDAVYGSSYSGLPAGSWGCASRSGSSLYLFLFDIKDDGKVLIPKIPGPVNSVELLNGPSAGFCCGKNLEITLPPGTEAEALPVIRADISGHEKLWNAYSEPAEVIRTFKAYAWKKVFSCAWINAVLNGILALFLYKNYTSFSFKEVFYDVIITVFIIVFINAWIAGTSLKKDLFMRNVLPPPSSPGKSLLPGSSVLAALVTGVVLTVLLGAGLTGGLLYLFSPEGMSRSGYIILKILYTGISGALASFIALRSVAAHQR